MGVASSLLPLQVKAEDVASGWNLLGNASPPFAVNDVFPDSAKVSSVWAWVPSLANWAFYSPAYTDGGKQYASEKGFSPLTTINTGQGFWVNAKKSFTYGPSTPPPVDLSDLDGSGNQLITYSASGTGCKALGVTAGSYSDFLNYNVTSNGATVEINIFDGTGYFSFTLDYQSGDNTSGYKLSGTFTEFSKGLSGSATGMSVKKKYGSMEGFLSGSLGNGCTAACAF